MEKSLENNDAKNEDYILNKLERIKKKNLKKKKELMIVKKLKLIIQKKKYIPMIYL